jgi:hypothetical protein
MTKLLPFRVSGMTLVARNRAAWPRAQLGRGIYFLQGRFMNHSVKSAHRPSSSNRMTKQLS